MQRVRIKIMVNKNRALYIFKYLWDHTDEEHPATTADIIAYLASLGISTTRKTVAEDAAELQNSGFDVICNRSRQNEFFIGSRHLELAELKLLVDAVQAAKFISPKKSKELIGKVTELASPYQGKIDILTEGEKDVRRGKRRFSLPPSRFARQLSRQREL
mgnify:CR=1 FL=1